MSSEHQVDLQPWVRNEHPTLHADPGALAGFDDHHSNGFEKELSLLACWNVLSKRRMTICITAFLLTAAVAIISFRMTPVYRATGRLEIEPETPLLQANSDYQRADADEVFLQTQIQVLRSENLAWQTIQQLHLLTRFVEHRSGDTEDSIHRKIPGRVKCRGCSQNSDAFRRV